jgi:hypothetical protein
MEDADLTIESESSPEVSEAGAEQRGVCARSVIIERDTCADTAEE